MRSVDVAVMGNPRHLKLRGENILLNASKCSSTVGKILFYFFLFFHIFYIRNVLYKTKFSFFCCFYGGVSAF